MLMNRVSEPAARRLPLLEDDANPLVLAPHHPAGLAPPFARHRQHEAIRKPERGVNLDRRARSRQVADRARDGLAAELDSSGLQHAVAGRDAVFVHDPPGYDSTAKVSDES